MVKMEESGSNKEGEKPICYGTYIGENDILCAKCRKSTKESCMKLTKIRIYP